jgi:hypothetical protein
VIGNDESLRKMLGAMESEAGAAMERLVAGEGFARLLVQLTENVVALSRIGRDTGDLVLRNLGMAGRRDIDRVARQLIRTEDKLERLLQAVERLEDASEHA